MESNVPTIFLAQVFLLIAVGRLLDELMQPIRQPALIGQLLAGIILGPERFWCDLTVHATTAKWPNGLQRSRTSLRK
jgi:Kef-type K+ transport system membrane component KefB